MENISTNKFNEFVIEDIQNPQEQTLKKTTRIRNKELVKYKNSIIKFNICVSVILIILLIVRNTEMVNISSDNLIVENANVSLYSQINSLEEVVTPFRSHNRIEKIASSSLNMVYPSSNDYVAENDSNDEKIIALEDINIENNSKNTSFNSIFSVITNLFR